MKKLISFLIFLNIIFVIKADASAQMGIAPGDMPPPPGRGPGPHKEGMREGGRRHRSGIFFGDPELIKERFGLSDEQVEKIGLINDNYRQRLLTVRENMEPKMNELHSLLQEDNINLKSIRSLLEAISTFEVEIRMLRINHILEIEKVLTDDQKKQLRNSMRRMMGSVKMENKSHFTDCKPLYMD